MTQRRSLRHGRHDLQILGRCAGPRLVLMDRSVVGLAGLWKTLPGRFATQTSVKSFQNMLTHDAKEARKAGTLRWQRRFSNRWPEIEP